MSVVFYGYSGFSTNKTDRHDITEILLKVALNTITLTPNPNKYQQEPGAETGFQVRRGALKKIAPSGGRREHIWGISCEKSRFYAKKSIFFQS